MPMPIGLRGTRIEQQRISSNRYYYYYYYYGSDKANRQLLGHLTREKVMRARLKPTVLVPA